MGDIKILTKNINYNVNPVGIYNQMRQVSKTSFHEVKRTLQAIKALEKYPKLLNEVIKVSEAIK